MLVYFLFKLRGRKIIMKKRKKIKLIVMILCALIFNAHSLLTSGVEMSIEEIPSSRCVTVDAWFNLVKAYVFFDAFFSIIFPFLLIASMNLLIVIRLIKLTWNIKTDIKSKSRHTSLQQSFELRAYINRRKSSVKKDSKTSLLSVLSGSQKQRRIEKYIKSCRMLFTISTVFILLNLPIAVCKIRYSFQAFESMADISMFDAAHDNGSHPYDEIFERVSCYMFYLNFSLNFLFYILSLKKFNIIYVFFNSVSCICMCKLCMYMFNSKLYNWML
jgi:hypothetical protein